jgi:phosphoribosylpyrophosphate synthetase
VHERADRTELMHRKVICTKVRDGNERIVKLKEGDPQGRHVIIVDDLVQSGSTLIECQKLLAAMGAAKVSAYVTHAVFPKRSWERFDHDNGGWFLFFLLILFPLLCSVSF